MKKSAKNLFIKSYTRFYQSCSIGQRIEANTPPPTSGFPASVSTALTSHFLVHSYDQHAYNKGTKHLAKDIIWYFFPGKSLPEGHSRGNSRIEVAARNRGAGDYGKCHAKGEGETSLKDTTEGNDAQPVILVQRKAGN